MPNNIPSAVQQWNNERCELPISSSENDQSCANPSPSSAIQRDHLPGRRPLDAGRVEEHEDGRVRGALVPAGDAGDEDDGSVEE